MFIDYTIGTKSFKVKKPPENWNQKNKNLPLILDHYTLAQRLDLFNAYLKMCGDQKEMEKDNFILEFPHVFSFSRNYQDCEMYGLKPIGFNYYRSSQGLSGLSDKSFSDYVYLQLVHSFSGENDNLVYLGLTHGIDHLRRDIVNNSKLKVLRSDLFQQYFTKNTSVRHWIGNEIYNVLCPYIVQALQQKREAPWKIMKLSENIYSWLKENTSQNRLKYATKDAVLDFSIVYPELVDAESYLEMGPGCKRGAYQLFGKYPKNVSQELEIYDEIKNSEGYPLKINHYSRLEAQLCYFYKHISMKTKWNNADKRRKKNN